MWEGFNTIVFGNYQTASEEFPNTLPTVYSDSTYISTVPPHAASRDIVSIKLKLLFNVGGQPPNPRPQGPPNKKFIIFFLVPDGYDI